jgi:hypothetical protein
MKGARWINEKIMKVVGIFSKGKFLDEQGDG